MIQLEDANPEQRHLLEQVQGAFGMIPNLTKALAASPAVLEGFLALGGAMNKTAFSPVQRELVAIAVAQANGCEYCLSAHTKIAEMQGAEEEDRSLARMGRVSGPVTAAAIDLARAIVATRGHLNSDAVAAAKAAGLSEAQVADVVGLVVLNIFTNYFNHVAGTPNDWPVVRIEEAIPA